MPEKKVKIQNSKVKSVLKESSAANKKAKDAVENQSFEQEIPASSSSSISKINIRKKYLIIALIVFVIIGVAYYFKDLFVVAIVNGQPITRVEVIQQLEKESGKKTLSSLVTKILILQEAKKQNISVSQSEIDSEIKKIEDTVSKQGQNLDQLLTLQGMTRQDLIDQIKIQKLVEKILAKDIKVTDSEVNDYIEKNKELISAGANPEETKQNVKTQLEQQKLSEKFQTWLTDLQKNAKIDYFVNY